MSDLEFALARQHAETVPCPHCRVPAAATCIRIAPRTTATLGSGQTLEMLPAHPARIRAASAHTQEDNQ